MHNIQICKTVCSTCPFRSNNSHLLYLDDVKDMLVRGTISPCHQDLAKYDGCTENSGVEIYAKVAKEFKVCRGFVEARLLAEIPSVTPVWKYLEAEFDKGDLCSDIVDLQRS